jgi:thymidylate kinase
LTTASTLATEAESRFTTVVGALNASQEPWAVLTLDDAGSDLSVLVEHPPKGLGALLRAEGFLTLRDPSAEQSVYVTYAATDDAWTRLNIGPSLRAIRGGGRGKELAHALLERRERVGTVSVLAPADAFWYSALRFLVQNSSVPPDAGALIAASRDSLDSSPLRALLATMDPALPDRVASTVAEGDTAALRGLRMPHGERIPGSSTQSPRSLRKLRLRGRGLTIAIVGPDGSGKTTLARALVESLPMDARYVYLGMWQRSRLRELIAPIPGARFVVVLSKLVARNAGVAVHRRLGRLVVIDRFTYDAEIPSVASDWRGRVSAKVLSRVTGEPDIAILLDAPAELMFARKGEHDPARLEALRSAYLRLAESHPRIVVLDGARPAEDVRRSAIAVVWEQIRYSGGVADRKRRR